MKALDTSEEAAAVQARIWREMGGDRRLELAIEMSDEARRVSAAGIAARHPEYDPEQVNFALWRMLYGDELFSAAWPDAPLLAP